MREGSRANRWSEFSGPGCTGLEKVATFLDHAVLIAKTN